MTHPDRPLLITLQGVDKPGITAEIAGLLAAEGVPLLDVEQVTVRGRLSLHFLIPGQVERPVLMSLLWKARELGVHVDFELLDVQNARPAATSAWAVTLLAETLSASVLADAAAMVRDAGFNILKIGRLSEGRLGSLELIAEGPPEADSRELQNALLTLRTKHAVDVALQREGLTRRSKRLVVMDMDSTLIQQEVIDELARCYGVMEQVAQITEAAMNGALPFDESLRARVRLLAGAPASILTEVQSKIELTPGAEKLVRVLKRLGYRLAVISGGFMEVVEPIQQRLGLDYAFANRLEVRDGLLTGELLGPIVNKQRKADLLESLAQAERVSLDQVIAIGDGANDLAMLGRAGLGIAFNAKRIVQEQANYAINQRDLSAILYLLGIHDAEASAV